MNDGTPRPVAQTQTLDALSRGESERRYLLVITGQSSSVFPLPALGAVVVGRGGGDGQISLDDPAASRRHAQFLVDANDVSIEDLGSHNGTYVDGVRTSGVKLLGRSSVVTIGAVSMILHREGRGAEGRVVAVPEFHRRATEEVARLLRRKSQLALVTVRAAVPALLQTCVENSLARDLGPADVATWSAEGDLLVLFPDADEDDPAELAERVRGHVANYVHSARAGVAACPTDGADIETLLATSRAACEQATAGTAILASELLWTRDVGGRTVVLVEPSMVRLYALIERLAKSDLPVLVEGETGTGKEHAASALHAWSPRAKGPLVTVNCAALPESLAESELFGHDKGAFSGAVSAKIGLLEAAHGGTLFLDEVGELSLSVQSKLLRALETRSIVRIGETRVRPVDVRFVTATHRDLHADVAAGRFRQDLLYRVGAASVVLPPLRDRRREIPVLARAFLTAACVRLAREPLTLDPQIMQHLLEHAWPGNVRELRNVMDFLAATALGPIAQPWELPSLVQGHNRESIRATPLESTEAVSAMAARPSAESGHETPSFRTLAEEIRVLERTRIREALSLARGVQTRAAELLGMPVRTLFAKLRVHGLDARDARHVGARSQPPAPSST